MGLPSLIALQPCVTRIMSGWSKEGPNCDNASRLWFKCEMFKNLPLNFLQILNSHRELNTRTCAYQILALWKWFMFMETLFNFGTKCTILNLNFLGTIVAKTFTRVYARDHGAKQHLGFQAYVGRVNRWSMWYKSLTFPHLPCDTNTNP